MYIYNLYIYNLNDIYSLFRDSLSRLAAELCSPRAALFAPVEAHAAGGAGADGGGHTETWAPDPRCADWGGYRFVGRVMAACARSAAAGGAGKEALAVNLPGLVWRRLGGAPTAWEDFAAMDPAQAALYDQALYIYIYI